MAARVASAMELDIYAELSSEKVMRSLVNLDGILLNKADNNQAVDPHACEATDHTAGAITGRDSLYCGWTRIIDSVARAITGRDSLYCGWTRIIDSVAPRHHTNILLDSGMTAHQMGSMGYMDPEYMRGSISCQPDVFSFGVILLEVIARNSSCMPSNKEYGGDNQIRNKDESRGLEWCTRFKIIKGICEGLDYLHNGSKEPIFHLDLKPANILLDHNMVPKIADFGLSRLFDSTQTCTTKGIIGTPGYMPPEYINRFQITKKFDVFSLGVIIIKMMAGPEGYSKCADMPSEEFINLVHKNWEKRFRATISLHASYGVKKCIDIALRCVEVDRVKRPTIAEIVDELNKIDINILNELNTIDSTKHSPTGQVMNSQSKQALDRSMNSDFLRFMTDSPTYRTRSSRSLEIDALLQALRCGQTRTRTKWRSRRTLKTDAVQKRESRTHNALLSKRDYNYCAGPENDSTLGSSEEDDTTMIDAYRQGAVPQHADLRLNRSVQTSIQAPEGGTVSSGGSDHPAAADRSSSTRIRSTMPSKLDSWFVATNVACSMTGDGSRLTDYMPTPTSNQVVHVPTYGFMVVIGRGSVRTETMSLHNGSVLHVRGLDKNLVSASQLVKLGYAITFGSSECRITKDDIVVGEAHFNDEDLVEIDFLRVA